MCVQCVTSSGAASSADDLHCTLQRWKAATGTHTGEGGSLSRGGWQRLSCWPQGVVGASRSCGEQHPLRHQPLRPTIHPLNIRGSRFPPKGLRQVMQCDTPSQEPVHTRVNARARPLELGDRPTPLAPHTLTAAAAGPAWVARAMAAAAPARERGGGDSWVVARSRRTTLWCRCVARLTQLAVGHRQSSPEQPGGDGRAEQRITPHLREARRAWRAPDRSPGRCCTSHAAGGPRVAPGRRQTAAAGHQPAWSQMSRFAPRAFLVLV